MELGTGKFSAEVVARPLLPGGGRSPLRIDLGARLNTTLNRVRNRLSDATLSVPIDGCDGRLWKVLRATLACELHVFRHVSDRKKRVFRGPIIRANRSPSRFRADDGSLGSISITAADPTWWLQGRYPPALAAATWDPATLAAWLYEEGRIQDPWDEEEIRTTLVGRTFRPDWPDIEARFISDWLGELDPLITWRVVDGVFEVAGLGSYKGSYIGVGGQDVRLRVTEKAWRDDPSELIEAANLTTLAVATRQTDRVFGGKVSSSFGTDFNDSKGKILASGRYGADGVDPIFGLLETRFDTDEDEKQAALDRWKSRNRPDIVIAPDATLDPCSPYDFDLWLPGVEVVVDRDDEQLLYRLDEVQVTGVGLGGGVSGGAPEDPRDVEEVRVLLSSVPDVDDGY